MTAADLARSHVERCLQDLWGVEQVVPDGDGDYRYGVGSAACYIRLDSHEPIVVKALAVAAVRVKKSAALLAEINDVNARTRMAHVFWQDGSVYVEQSLMVETLDRASLSHAGLAVGGIANDVGSMIATVYGGSMPLQAGEDYSEQPE
jgi:hypothetical protein